MSDQEFNKLIGIIFLLSSMAGIIVIAIGLINSAPKISKSLNAYRFCVGGNIRYIYALDMEEALDKLIDNHFATYLSGDIIHLSSTDEKAPRDWCEVIPKQEGTLLKLID